MATVVDGKLDDLLNTIRNSADFATGCQVALFSNNIVFDETITLGALTEAAWSGYARQPILSWSAATGGSGGLSVSSAPAVTFAPGTLGTPEDNYGWYLLDQVGNLVGGDNFVGGPLNMGGTTTAVQITPSLTCEPV